MTTYKIKINYKTGNSFGSSNVEDFIEYEWCVLNRAKESLQRIKNHYDFYEKNGDWKKPECETPEGVVWDEEYRFLGLELLTDGGNPFHCSPFWTGYFETLYDAEIVVSGDTDMKVTFN